jgi:uncharacterized membrane protein
MKIRAPLIASLCLIAAMVAVSAWAWPALSPDARIAIHWGFDGKPNGYAPKDVALAIMPAMAAILTAIFALWPRFEPRRANLAQSRLAYEAGWLGVVAVLAVAHVIVVMQARGATLDVANIVLVAVAILFMVLGNFLGKSRSNFFFGVRTPWSLSSDLAWEHANRATGRLLMVTGLATLAALLLAGDLVAVVTLSVGATASALAGVALSYIYWRRDPDRHASDGAYQ